MTPSKLSIMLGISILLGLPPATAAAGEPATPADLAALASSEQQLQAEFDDQLRASVFAVTENEGQAIAVRMTELLRQQTRRGQADAPPPAKRALAAEPAPTRVRRGGDTVCTRVGHTLECVLQDLAYR